MSDFTVFEPSKDAAAMQLLTEDLLSMKQAREEIPTRPDISTLQRWRLRGVRGVKLETVKIGGFTLTSRQAIHRFLAATQNRA